MREAQIAGMVATYEVGMREIEQFAREQLERTAQ